VEETQNQAAVYPKINHSAFSPKQHKASQHGA